MRKTPLYLTFGLLVAAIISIYSCTKKVNGINNDQVVETPYSLYFSDTAGALYNSTDGKTIKTIFNPDGFPCRAICVDNSNILWAKTNLYASINNGVNFNHAYDSLTQNPFKSCNGLNMDLNQSMMIDIPDWSMAFTTSTYNSFSENYLGVVFSLNVGGILGSWWADLPDTPAVFGGPIAFGSRPTPYM